MRNVHHALKRVPIAPSLLLYRTSKFPLRFRSPRWTRPLQSRPVSTQNVLSSNPDSSRIRNIGIIAHIDAGKTTTTERMLYYSGHTRRIGDVDDGSTVTDFLPAERARGITIQSAAITFHWPPLTTSDAGAPDVSPTTAEGLASSIPHQINLIDTPGHADFTFEVRRSLRVLDGAICILDGVAGVEAQTEQVWIQAGEWNIPRIAYVNKLDREGASFATSVRQIGARFGAWPALCQIPWFEGGKGRFTGVGDVLSLCGLKYGAGSDGKTVETLSLDELTNVEADLATELRRARVALVELLSEHDEILVEAFLEADGDHLAVRRADLTASLRRVLLQGNSPVIPVFAGASFRNIGVQPLLDAINDLLPNPYESPDPQISIGRATGLLSTLVSGTFTLLPAESTAGKVKKPTTSNTIVTAKSLKGCALAFKVVNDPRKGVLVYIRVYHGRIDRNALIYNTNLQTAERASNLLRMYASESVQVQSIEAGQIGVIAGSKFARTGDTLIVYEGNKSSPPEPLGQLQLRPIHVPPPVFFAAIEPNSLRDEKDMHEKLGLLLREDPSLHVTQDEDTGQTLLSGMGELHLEIARDRLVNDLKANARMGTIAIGYRESLMSGSDTMTKIYENNRSDSRGRAGCSVVVSPLSEAEQERVEADERWSSSVRQDGNIVVVECPNLDERGRSLNDDCAPLPTHLAFSDVQVALVNGAFAALSRGPTYNRPMRGTLVHLILDTDQHIFGTDTTLAALTSAARLATVAALKDAASKSGSSLMEPVMDVEISVDEKSMGSVIQDISSSRGGHIVSLGDTDEVDSDDSTSTKVDVRKIYAPRDPFESGDASIGGFPQELHIQRHIKAKVPLKEMVGYLKHLRSMTGGRGTFVMNIDRFERVTGQREKSLITELRGE